jgi:hypothetical protein
MNHHTAVTGATGLCLAYEGHMMVTAFGYLKPRSLDLELKLKNPSKWPKRGMTKLTRLVTRDVKIFVTVASMLLGGIVILPIDLGTRRLTNAVFTRLPLHSTAPSRLTLLKQRKEGDSSMLLGASWIVRQRESGLPRNGGLSGE